MGRGKRTWMLGPGAMGLLVLGTGCFSGAPEAGGSARVASAGGAARCLTPEQAEVLADQVMQLVNLERAERGLQPVEGSQTLKRVAEDYACRMVTQEFFGHRDPLTGHGPAERAIAGKYRFYAIGENLAAGADTPTEVMKLWMDSPSHREIILDPNWRELGIGVRSGGAHSVYWVQEFGDPADF